MVGVAGIGVGVETVYKLACNAVRSRKSEAIPANLLKTCFWWGWLGLNQRPTGYEPAALTAELHPHTRSKFLTNRLYCFTPGKLYFWLVFLGSAYILTRFEYEPAALTAELHPQGYSRYYSTAGHNLQR